MNKGRLLKIEQLKVENTINKTSTTSKPPKSPKPCLKCTIGWKTATIDSKTVCLVSLSNSKPAAQLAGLCKSIGGKLPLPSNMKENDDYKTEILRLFPFMIKKHSTFVLDLKNEETFVDSFGNQPSFTD